MYSILTRVYKVIERRYVCLSVCLSVPYVESPQPIRQVRNVLENVDGSNLYFSILLLTHL